MNNRWGKVMEKIKITVIIAVYNKLAQLGNILQAFNEQIELPDEIIIVDDGSSEKIEDKLKNIIPKLKYKIKHIWQEDKGFRVASSRNNGIINASGDYIVFVDQDILFDKNFVQNIRKSIRKNEVLKMRAVYLDEERTKKINDIIFEEKTINFEKIKGFIKKEEYKHLNKRYRDDTLKNILFKLGLRKRSARVVSLGMGAWKKDLLKVNGFDERYVGWGGEDHDLGNRLSALGLGLRTIDPSNIIVHMWHPIASGESPNNDYFDKREKEILDKKEYTCEYGCNNRLIKEELKIKELN